MARPKKIKTEEEGMMIEHGVSLKEALIPETPHTKIIPSIEVRGQINAFQKLFEENPEKLPTIISVGYAKMPGTNTYVAYRIFSKGPHILKIEVEEPNLRMIAEESAKILFVNSFMAGDEDVPLI